MSAKRRLRMRGMRTAGILFFLLAVLGIDFAAHAGTLHLRAPDGKILNADYRRGDVHRPAILVMHGFLQTYDFLTTESIINSLSSLGYTVIGPNLSLGISDRQQSMQCQAPHDHRFEGDLREIDFWVQWLRKQGYSRIILVGHSWGSQHDLGYAEAYPQAPISAVIAISLVRTEQTAAVRAKQLSAAKARLARRDKSLHAYALSFCKTFMASPASYLSYAAWTDQRTLDALAQLRERKLPVYVVVGSADKRIDPDWVQAVRGQAHRVDVIEGANHFFSSVHEFDLSDRLQEILTQIDPSAKK